MLPTVATDTIKSCGFAAEVAGRLRGVAAMANLVPEAERRAALEKSANAIDAVGQQAAGAYTARLLFELVENRTTIGKGRGVDRGFGAAVAVTSETVRTSLPDRNPRTSDYTAIFPNGTEEYTAPSIKEDPEFAAELRKSIADSTLAVKTGILALLDTIVPVVGPAAQAVRDGEAKVNELFQTEVAARKLLIDTLWQERKNVEATLGRSGRGLARFIFFDFRKDSAKEEEEPTEGAPPAAEAPKAPEPK